MESSPPGAPSKRRGTSRPPRASVRRNLEEEFAKAELERAQERAMAALHGTRVPEPSVTMDEKRREERDMFVATMASINAAMKEKQDAMEDELQERKMDGLLSSWERVTELKKMPKLAEEEEEESSSLHFASSEDEELKSDDDLEVALYPPVRDSDFEDADSNYVFGVDKQHGARKRTRLLVEEGACVSNPTQAERVAARVAAGHDAFRITFRLSWVRTVPDFDETYEQIGPDVCFEMPAEVADFESKKPLALRITRELQSYKRVKPETTESASNKRVKTVIVIE